MLFKSGYLPPEIIDHIYTLIDYKSIFTDEILPFIPSLSKCFFEKHDRSRQVQLLTETGDYCITCYCSTGYPNCTHCKHDEYYSFGTGIIVWITMSEFRRFCDQHFLDDTPVYPFF